MGPLSCCPGTDLHQPWQAGGRTPCPLTDTKASSFRGAGDTGQRVLTQAQGLASPPSIVPPLSEWTRGVRARQGVEGVERPRFLPLCRGFGLCGGALISELPWVAQVGLCGEDSHGSPGTTRDSGLAPSSRGAGLGLRHLLWETPVCPP